nr:hypothetical protein GCM10025699_53780 [Microbacterium flavescens]
MIVREPRVPSPYRSRLAAFDVRDDVVAVSGSATRYWTYEPSGSEEARVTVVAVHGFRGDHHGLEPVVAHLTGVRVIMPDLPGFGESSPSTASTAWRPTPPGSAPSSTRWDWATTSSCWATRSDRS